MKKNSSKYHQQLSLKNIYKMLQRWVGAGDMSERKSCSKKKQQQQLVLWGKVRGKTLTQQQERKR